MARHRAAIIDIRGSGITSETLILRSVMLGLAVESKEIIDSGPLRPI
jgi:hypothetical protein